MSALAPYDGVLLVSFGGPERPEDVLPFLQNVTRGRPVPPHRLAAVAEHYHAVGGRSPINEANRVLLAALRAELDACGVDQPLWWGNRNWHPLLTEALTEAHEAGARRLVAIVTSLYPSWSGCRQYRGNLDDAVRALADQGRELTVDVVRPYGTRDGVTAAVVDALDQGLHRLEALGPDAARTPRVVFVTHSIPLTMAQASGPTGDGYRTGHRRTAESVIEALTARHGRRHAWDLVYCSRSGSPDTPWLEPDIDDHLVQLARQGCTGVVVVPIGFVSDHMEVVYDLDTQAADVARGLGLGFVRTPTVGTDPRFVVAMVEALADQAAQARGERLPDQPACCGEGCCLR